MSTPLLPVLLSALPIFSTFMGGFLVYRWKKDLHPWLSLSGGILLGVAFLDLLPEAIGQATSSGFGAASVTGVALLAILLFHIIDASLSFHAHHHHPDTNPLETCENEDHRKTKTFIRAGSMIIHSLLDGVAIGAGFAASQELGILVTTAVILHDFSDGMSTVTLLKSGLGQKHKAILPFLVIDALAPLVGSLIGVRLGLERGSIAFMLAFFAGFFIFLALSDLLPQAHRGNISRKFGIFLTTLGILLVIFIRTFANV